MAREVLLNKLEHPYPGVRPFLSDEAVLFFGRQEQVDRLLERLDEERFLMVVGSSGCGKSSLVRAGLIPALEAGLLPSAGARWAVATMLPGDLPLKKLAAALLADEVLSGKGPVAYTRDSLLSELRRGPLSLLEVLDQEPQLEGRNLLLLVDQFEEIFRFIPETSEQARELPVSSPEDKAASIRDKCDEAEAFVALLLETANREWMRKFKKVGVYIVLTMRSDFLGLCDTFPGLPEKLSESLFITPRMTRDQLMSAIESPALVCNGSFDNGLVNRMLNEMKPWPDQLPLLQHTLMRMWDTASTRPGPVHMTLKDFEEAGGYYGSLSRHANTIYKALGAGEKQKVAEVLFRCLSERKAGRPATRRNVRLDRVVAIAEPIVLDSQPISLDQKAAFERLVRDVVDVFREPDIYFVMPPREPGQGAPLDPETVLDISHECVIRNWDKLRDEWLEEEAKKAADYRYLVQRASYWNEEKGWAKLLTGTELDWFLVWMNENRPNAAWAELYGDQSDFHLLMEYLDKSKEERNRKRSFRSASHFQPGTVETLDEIARWEDQIGQSKHFWVVLPSFLGDKPEFFSVMLNNIVRSDTLYFYFLESKEDIQRLKDLKRKLQMDLDTLPWCDLRLMSSLNDVTGIPTEGKNLIVVAAVDNVLHFHIFDGDGKVVVDTDETRLTEQARQIKNLRKQLQSLWPPHELTTSEKGRVITAVTSIATKKYINNHILDIKMDPDVFTHLLKNRYYWIRNPEGGAEAEGYEVVFKSENMPEPCGGVKVGAEELNNVIQLLKALTIVARETSRTGQTVQVGVMASSP